MLVMVLVALVVQTMVGIVLIYKVWTLTNKLNATQLQASADRAIAEEDRRLTHQLLQTVKGWAFIMERQEGKKAEQVLEVASAAAKTTEDIKQAVATAASQVPEETANRILEKLEQKGFESGSLSRPLLGGT